MARDTDKKRKHLTIADVARIAGVSGMTVKRVLDQEDCVREETRERVLKVVKELGYVRNPNARALSKRKNFNIGILISRSLQGHVYTESFMGEIIDGIQGALVDTDYHALIEATTGSHDSDLPKSFRQRKIDGAIIMGAPFSPSFIKALSEEGLPIVITSRYLPLSELPDTVSAVEPANQEGGMLAARHLIEKGHKDIFVIGVAKNRVHQERFHGALSEIKRTGLKVNEPIFCMNTPYEAGKNCAKELLERGKLMKRAFFITHAQIGIGFLDELSDAKVNIPNDISVIVYGDLELLRRYIPPITTVGINYIDLGYTAAVELLKRLEVPNIPKAREINPMLFERASVKDINI